MILSGTTSLGSMATPSSKDPLQATRDALFSVLMGDETCEVFTSNIPLNKLNMVFLRGPSELSYGIRGMGQGDCVRYGSDTVFLGKNNLPTISPDKTVIRGTD
jgi:hypothetical protein